MSPEIQAIGLALAFAGFAATVTLSADLRGTSREDATTAYHAFAESHSTYHACISEFYRILDEMVGMSDYLAELGV